MSCSVQSMPSLPQRYAFIALAAICLLLLYQLPGDHRHVVPPVSVPHYTPLPPSRDGAWSWKDYEPHYSLDNLTPLPMGKAKPFPPVQHRFRAESKKDRTTRLERQDAVKHAFIKCWRSYRTRAWMKDELAPLSGSGGNYFGGWSASLVDALDTLWIMGMEDEFNEAVEAAVDIDFTTSTDDTINVFETTIRYLGGFLAAYDLSGDMRLLHKAVEVGEMLLVPFDTPNHMPITRWHWQTAKQGADQEAPSSTIVSELGSLSMEFTRLSQLTQDPRWYDAIDRITRLFDAQQMKTQLPGMWPVMVNPRDEDLTSDNEFTLGGMADSLYEYFPKQHILLGGLEPVYQRLYEDSMATAARYIFFRPMNSHNADLLVSGSVRVIGSSTSAVLDPQGQHLGCFVGGMLALGGRIFGNEEHVSMAKKVTDACIWAYNVTSVGVMSEVATFYPCASLESCLWDEQAWKTAVHEQMIGSTDVDDHIASHRLAPGYIRIPDPRYILRPEALESVFYMYRVTGDRFYLESAWNMFTSIVRISETEFGHAAVTDITAVGADGLPPKDDRMESFWLAETLKYAYLIFSEPDLISLDDFVFNTEAHPFRRPV